MSKKILAIVLALVMCLTMLPVTALAVEPHNHNDIEFKPWATATELPTDGGSYYLDTDVELTDTWKVSSATPTNLCLNGHVIKQAEDDKRVITITDGATLNLYDCDKATEHYFKDSGETDGLWVLDDTLRGDGIKHTVFGGVITGGKMTGATFGGSIGILSNSNFEMYGGTICGNKAGFGGGIGITVGNFTMHSGTICGNAASQSGGGGGGVNVLSTTGSSFTMYGGMISGNTAAGFGGGVFVQNNSNFEMYGGEISGNAAMQGGGVTARFGDITMTGGTISGNTAKMAAGGVAVGSGSFTVGGTAVIENNTDDSGASNACVYFDKTSITLADGESAPKEGSMHIYVTVLESISNPVPVSGQFTDSVAAKDAKYFISDNEAYKVKYNRDGKYLELVEDNGSTLLRLLRAALVTVTTVHHLIHGVTTSAARIAKIAAFNAALPVLIARWFRHF